VRAYVCAYVYIYMYVCIRVFSPLVSVSESMCGTSSFCGSLLLIWCQTCCKGVTSWTATDASRRVDRSMCVLTAPFIDGIIWGCQAVDSSINVATTAAVSNTVQQRICELFSSQ
jgi:hypothetical protein